MKKAVLILSVLALVVNSCRQATKEQTKTTDNKIAIEQNSEKLGAVATISIENGEENFKTFLENFGTDSTFQLSRIVFPLKILEYAWGEDGNLNTDSITVSIINLENHRFLEGFALNSNPIEIYGYEYPTDSDIKAFSAENEYFAEIIARSVMRISEDEYFVHFFAVEACGRTGYHFKKYDNGQWYLVEIDAKST